MDAQRDFIFISRAGADEEVIRPLIEQLESLGLRCWIAPRDLPPGSYYGEAIADAICAAKAFVLILSSWWDTSAQVFREIECAISHHIPLIPYRIENFTPDKSKYKLGPWIDGAGPDLAHNTRILAEAIHKIVPGVGLNAGNISLTVELRQDQSKGYVFISYVRKDTEFVHELRSILETRKYGYWDYVIGNRDYHGALYRELEERIDGAAAFLSIVSDDWRHSDWVAAEYLYAKEAKIPIFVIQAKRLARPMPILLNLQTRIDMSEDFEHGAQVLADELLKEGL